MKKILILALLLVGAFAIYGQDNVRNSAITVKTAEDLTPPGAYESWFRFDAVSKNFKAWDSVAGTWINVNGAAASLAFDGNRSILRAPTAGTNLGTSTITEWLEWWYFAPPTITCNLSPTTTVYEIGTSNSIIISGATSNPGSATLSNGELTRTNPASNVVNSFTTSVSYSSPITYNPQQGGSGDYNELLYSFQATQDWSFGSEAGTATSTSRTIRAVYPVLYGMDVSDLSGATGSTLYTTLSDKLIETEGDKENLIFSGTNEFIYIAVPKSWTDFDLSSIEDPNTFNILGGFTTHDVTITSSGLVNNWTQDYKLYKLASTTTVSPAASYKIFR